MSRLAVVAVHSCIHALCVGQAPTWIRASGSSRSLEWPSSQLMIWTMPRRRQWLQSKNPQPQGWARSVMFSGADVAGTVCRCTWHPRCCVRVCRGEREHTTHTLLYSLQHATSRFAFTTGPSPVARETQRRHSQPFSTTGPSPAYSGAPETTPSTTYRNNNHT